MADLADARRRAEEYLRFWGHNESDGMEIMRALLARIVELESLLRECNAVCLCGCPESEHESYGEDGESCADEGHECIRVAPAVLAYVERLRSTPPPPSDAVPEAVMAGAELLSAVRGAPTGSIGAIDNTYLPQIGREWLRPIEERIDAGVSALAASPATLATVTVPAGVAGPDDPIRVRLVPDDAAVREAAEVVRTILTAHDARLSESGVLTYGPPSKGTGFVAAIQWLRRYDAARGGE